MLRTRMFSDSPGTPARRQQMPRMSRSIWTPAWLAAYSASIISASPIELALIVIRPSAPNAASLLDQLEQPRAQVARRHDERVVALVAAVAGEVVEQLGDVGADVDVAREDAEVLVEPGRLGVVVAGADVAVAAQLVAVVADDEHALGVGLQPDHAVHDVHAGALELLGPVDVGGLVEAGLELDEHGDLHAPLGGPDQAADDRAVAAGPVQRHLDRLHARVVGRLLDERLGARW